MSIFDSVLQDVLPGCITHPGNTEDYRLRMVGVLNRELQIATRRLLFLSYDAQAGVFSINGVALQGHPHLTGWSVEDERALSHLLYENQLLIQSIYEEAAREARVKFAVCFGIGEPGDPPTKGGSV